MAIRLVPEDLTIIDDVSLIETRMSTFDTLNDASFDDYDRDELLNDRSAMEFVRDQLSVRQVAELDQVDAHWRDNPSDFNAAFVIWHRKASLRTVQGLVVDDGGKAPDVPTSHWWWRPLGPLEV